MTSGIDAALTPYRVLRNMVDYPIRRRLKVRRPVRTVKAVGVERALELLEPPDRREAVQLLRDYGLEGFAARGTRRDVLENLFYLDLLVTALAGANVQLPVGKVQAIDVGVGHWFYVHALYGALRHWRAALPRQVELLGFEVDPYRVYSDGHSRADWADWYLRGLPEALFVAEDVRRWQTTCNIAFMLFPFVFATDADKWGLPRTMFKPLELLQHVWKGIQPGGSLVIVNQGRRESEAQQKLLAAAGIPVATSTRFSSPFFRYTEPRYVHVALKRASSRSLTSTPRPGRSPAR